MSKKCLYAFSYLLLFLFLHVASAQNTQEKQLLTEVLKDLENRYQCNFSYSDEDIQGITIKPPSPKLTFKEAITYLKENSTFLFNILEDRFITIFLPDKRTIFICGIIQDSETKQPIEGATIESAFFSIVSNANGYFEKDNVSVGDSLKIRHLGYATQKVVVGNTNKNCVTFWLKYNVEELNEVVISNYITKGITKTSEGFFKINYDTFGILPGVIDSDALLTLQSLPGINSLDESVTNINIRGGSHDQNYITWNGIKMYQAGHFFNLISAFNPNMTKKVTLIKNGTPSSLSSGVSGTIAIESSDKINTDFKSTIGINLIDINGLLDIPLGKKASIQIAGRRSYSDVINTHASKHYFEKAFQNTEVIQNQSNVISTNDNFRFFDMEAVLNYKISEKDKIQISFINAQNSLSFLESAFIRNVEKSRISTSEQKNMAFGLFFYRNWGSSFKTIVQLYNLNYSLNATNFDILKDSKLRQENSIEETKIKLSLSYSINKKISITGGYSFIKSEIYNLEEFSNPFSEIYSKNVVRKKALFSELKFNSLANKTRLKLGTRLNYMQPFNTFILEPRLSFNQQLSATLTWDVLGEFKHQTETQTVDFQNDFLGVENRRWIASNTDDVPIIRGKQVSSGLTYKKNGWLINAEIFYKKVEGIVAQSQEFRNQYQYSKAKGDYYGNGVDFLIHKKINHLSIWGSYSYLNINYKFLTLQSNSFYSNFNIKHSFDIGVIYTFKKIKIATGLKWYSGKPTTNPIFSNEVVNGVINYEAANSSNLPDYFRWDFSFTHNFKIKEVVTVNTGVSLWNITNRKNVITKYYEFTDINFPSKVIQKSLEFTPNFLLKITF